MGGRGALGAVALAIALSGQAGASGATLRTFAPVPSPGQPEGIAVAPDGTVYVGSDAGPFGIRPEGTPPAKVFAFGADGRLRGDWTIEGETRDGTTSYGVFGLALDANGVVYAVDHNPPRIVALDPRTGAQRDYARFRDVPSCTAAGRTTDCSATVGNQASFPNFAVFAPDGTMYVTDLQQALIWRVPPGGGRPEVWFTDPRLEAEFGPNGAQMEADGRTLMFAVSTSGPQGGTPGLYAVAVQPDGSAGPLRSFWQARPNDAPDGFQIAQSGNVWVVAGGAGQVVVLDAQGQELRRIPSPGDQEGDVPFDAPANVVLLGDRALVTNHAWVVYAPPHWAVLEVTPAEAGLPYFTPPQPPVPPLSRCSCTAAGTRIRLSVRPRVLVAGRRTLVRFVARVPRRGHLRPLAGVTVRFAGRRLRTDRRGRAHATVRPVRPGRLRALATRTGGYLTARAVVRVRAR